MGGRRVGSDLGEELLEVVWGLPVGVWERLAIGEERLTEWDEVVGIAGVGKVGVEVVWVGSCLGVGQHLGVEGECHWRRL